MKKILSIVLVSSVLTTNVYAGTHALERASNALNEAIKLGADAVNNISCSINNVANNSVSSSATPSSSVGFATPPLVRLPCNYN